MAKSSFYGTTGPAPEDITTIADYVAQAEAAKAAAEAAYDNFDDLYLGSKTTDPSVDNDGDPLVTGALYFNSASGILRVYNGSVWQDAAGGGDMLASTYDPDSITEQLVGVNATQSLTNKTLTSVLLSGQADTVGFSPTLSTHLVHKGYVDATDIVLQGDIATNAADIAQLQSDLSGYQPLDSDLTAISSATLTGDGHLIRVSGAWFMDSTNYQPLDADLTTIAAANNGSTLAGINQGLATTDSPTFAGLTVDTNTLYVDAASNEVGIGTTSPSAKLDVVGGDAKINGATVGLGGGGAATNLAFGTSALLNNTTGITNLAFGTNALLNNTIGAENTAVGAGTLASNIDGSFNTAVGRFGLNKNTSGVRNTALGPAALANVTTGSYNTALANVALNNVTTGNYNTAVGQNTGNGITTGSFNTIIGAGVTGLSATLANNVIIADGQGNRRINIDGSGNVGIGTTSPSAKLDVVGNAEINGNTICTGYVKTQATTVAGLTAAATAGAGARSFVTDATATTFASVVAGGGANAVPVYSDGTDWRIG